MNTPLHRTALMLPCLNEEAAIGKVIRDFRRACPGIQVYVFDNGSTDRSREIALAENATVITVPRRGKGNVVRRMFESIDADTYVMVDADDTYDPAVVGKMIHMVEKGEADMVVATRLQSHSPAAFRRFHRIGNRFFLFLINTLFSSRLTDIFSGYRVMSRSFVKNIPLLRQGFEIETELTVYSLLNGFEIREIPARYRDRPANSFSKLRSFSDGYKILLTVIWLVRDLRPLFFFGLSAMVCAALAVILHGVGSADIYSGFALVIAVGFATTGLTLNTINVKFAEMQGIYRRNLPAPSQERTRHDRNYSSALEPDRALVGERTV